MHLEILADRHTLRGAVDSRTGREDQPLDTMGCHDLIQVDRTGNVVFVIQQRLGNRFADSLVSGKMDNRINFVFPEDGFQTFPVQQIGLIELRFCAGNGFNPVQHSFAGIIQIVHDHNFVACLNQFNACMGTDIAGSASYQNSCHLFSFSSEQTDNIIPGRIDHY